tara:strand:- start:3033 stop:3677 length:645 start_codon:yes stop_codon:yes gene_type:complete
MNISNININRKIIKSPKKSNSLSKELKNKIKSKHYDKPSSKPSDKSINKSRDIKLNNSLKKIKLSPSNKRSNKKSSLFIPTNLSNKVDSIKKKEVLKEEQTLPSINNTNTNTDNNTDNKPNIKVSVKPNIKKLSKKKSRKSTRNKTISIKLNNKAKKEKDILEIVSKFEKMNIKEIKDFLKTKGITTTNKNKSKLLPYIYLLTCVDDDINIIKK